MERELAKLQTIRKPTESQKARVRDLLKKIAAKRKERSVSPKKQDSLRTPSIVNKAKKEDPKISKCKKLTGIELDSYLSTFLQSQSIRLAMTFQAFLIRHAIYKHQPTEKVLRCIRTKSFGMDFISYLREPSTRQDEFNQAADFLIALGVEDREAKPGFTFREVINGAALRKGLISLLDETTEAILEFEDQTTNQEGKGKKFGESPVIIANSEEDENGSEQETEHNRPSANGDTPLKEARYLRYRGSEGQRPLEIFFFHADGSLYTKEEQEEEIREIGERFDNDRTPLNPNELPNPQDTTRPEWENESKIGYESYPLQELINIRQAYASRAHHAKEGDKIWSTAPRRLRIRESMISDTKVAYLESIRKELKDVKINYSY